jgi:hypothetical protein
MTASRRLLPRTVIASDAIALVAAAIALVLGVLALFGVVPLAAVSIAAICLGVALLGHGAVIARRVAQFPRPSGATDEEAGIGETAGDEVLGGSGAIVFGVLALLGLEPMLLLGVAAMTIGGVLLLASDFHQKLPYIARVKTLPMYVIAGAWALAGIAAVTLGVIAVAGVEHALALIEIAFVVGSAATIAAALTRLPQFVGTPAFVEPPAAQQREAAIQSDEERAAELESIATHVTTDPAPSAAKRFDLDRPHVEPTTAESTPLLEPPHIAGTLEAPHIAGELVAPKIAAELQAPKVAGELEPPKVSAQLEAPVAKREKGGGWKLIAKGLGLKLVDGLLHWSAQPAQPAPSRKPEVERARDRLDAVEPLFGDVLPREVIGAVETPIDPAHETVEPPPNDLLAIDEPATRSRTTKASSPTSAGEQARPVRGERATGTADERRANRSRRKT